MIRRQPIPIRLDPDLYKAFSSKVKTDGGSVGQTFEDFMRSRLDEHANPRGSRDTFAILCADLAVHRDQPSNLSKTINVRELKRIMYNAALYSKASFNQYLDVLLTTETLKENYHSETGAIVPDVWVIK